jgi:hypothetical protein
MGDQHKGGSVVEYVPFNFLLNSFPHKTVYPEMFVSKVYDYLK